METLMAKKKVDPAEALSRVFCNYPDDTGNLSAKELAALHLCKHEVVAAVYRFYTIVPPKKAAYALKAALNKLTDALS
jgi:hypothetical protein